jgi:hypothetical protein
MSNNYALIFTDYVGFEHEIVEFDRPSAEDFEYIEDFIKSLKEDIRCSVTFASEYVGDDDFIDEKSDEADAHWDYDIVDDHDHVHNPEDLFNLNYVENSFKLYEEYHA